MTTISCKLSNVCESEDLSECFQDLMERMFVDNTLPLTDNGRKFDGYFQLTLEFKGNKKYE